MLKGFVSTWQEPAARAGTSCLPMSRWGPPGDTLHHGRQGQGWATGWRGGAVWPSVRARTGRWALGLRAAGALQGRGRVGPAAAPGTPVLGKGDVPMSPQGRAVPREGSCV